MVLTFILQPLIENAIKHGISGMLEQGITKSFASWKEGLAFIEIEDNTGTYNDRETSDGIRIKIVDR